MELWMRNPGLFQQEEAQYFLWSLRANVKFSLICIEEKKQEKIKKALKYQRKSIKRFEKADQDLKEIQETV